MLSKSDYKILYQLYEYGCFNQLKSVTVEKLSNMSQLSVSKVRKTIKQFIQVSYVCEGIRECNAKTYYITKKGINNIKKLSEEE